MRNTLICIVSAFLGLLLASEGRTYDWETEQQLAIRAILATQMQQIINNPASKETIREMAPKSLSGLLDENEVVLDFKNPHAVWDLQTGNVLSGGIIKPASWVHPSMHSPDGARRFTIYGDSAVIVDSQTGMPLMLLNSTGVKFGGFSPDGRRLTTVSGDTITLWDAQTGQQILRLRDHGRVMAGMFKSDGTQILMVYYRK